MHLCIHLIKPTAAEEMQISAVHLPPGATVVVAVGMCSFDSVFTDSHPLNSVSYLSRRFPTPYEDKAVFTGSVSAEESFR